MISHESKLLFVIIWIISVPLLLFAQIPDNGIDVLHYNFELTLNDSNNIIYGKATILIRFTKEVSFVCLDLVNKSEGGKGMTVSSVTKNNSAIKFSQDAQHVILQDIATTGSQNNYSITYDGIPSEGLIIQNNKYNHRTFFGDNWPNRAHHWLPCNDHVSDKASVDFIITAPVHYQVVSNGIEIEETNLENNLKLTHWKEEVPVSPKIMVMGVADFAMNLAGNVNHIPVSSWVYPEDKEKGFFDYGQAIEILPFFIQHVGPYAYGKLANVESNISFGGMENANTIFYYDRSITGTRSSEELLAHEIAHQWFGNAVTETDWPQIWLSEGFATYMTHLYLENKYGTDTLLSRLKIDRNKIIRFSKWARKPIIDSTESKNLMNLLNANSYEKGGWVLHMLRRKLGDSIFWQGIRSYYAVYNGRNASTDDLQRIFEEVSDQDLGVFFNQWLYSPDHPKLKIGWSHDSNRKILKLNIEQLQNKLFDFPLDIGISDGEKITIETMNIREKTLLKEIKLDKKPSGITLDPNVNLLFEAEIEELK